MQEFCNTLLSNLTIPMYAAYIVAAWIGFVGFAFIDLQYRRPESKQSPKQFSIKYWLKDNKKRLLFLLIAIPIAVPIGIIVLGSEFSIPDAVQLGFTCDIAAVILKRNGMLNGYNLPNDDLTNSTDS